jgi:hypothetical protein
MSEYRLERHVDKRAMWRVLAPSGEPVGIVTEEREWLGDDYGPPTYATAHNPTGEPFEALWRAEGFSTPKAALEALASHLDETAGRKYEGS